MKRKILAAGLVLAFVSAGSIFADGIKAGGYIRAGIQGNFNKEKVDVQTYNDGKYYGNDKARLRVNLDFSVADYGAVFRYQADKFSDTAEDWFKEKTVKYAMGYGKFFDGKFIGEGGKLKDSYTASDGYEGFDFGHYRGCYGVRGVLNPVEGLYLSVQGSTLHARKYNADSKRVKDGDVLSGDIRFNEKLLSFSGKYSNSLVSAAFGYHLGGEAYAYLGVKAVKNLKANFEYDWLHKEVSEKKNRSNEKTDFTTLVEDVSYNFKDLFAPWEIGMLAYQKFVVNNDAFEFYPYTSLAVTKFLSVGYEMGVRTWRTNSEWDENFSHTASVTLSASKAALKIFYTFDQNEKNILGSTVKVTF